MRSRATLDDMSLLIYVCLHPNSVLRYADDINMFQTAGEANDINNLIHNHLLLKLQAYSISGNIFTSAATKILISDFTSCASIPDSSYYTASF